MLEHREKLLQDRQVRRLDLENLHRGTARRFLHCPEWRRMAPIDFVELLNPFIVEREVVRRSVWRRDHEVHVRRHITPGIGDLPLQAVNRPSGLRNRIQKARTPQYRYNLGGKLKRS